MNVATRAVVAAVFGAPLAFLLWLSPWADVVPRGILGAPMPAIAFVALAGAAFVATGSARRPLPPLLAIAVAVEAVALYPYSTIDWSRVLKDWGLAEATLSPAVATLVAALPFAAAFVAHVADHMARVGERYGAKGVAGQERDAVVADAERRGLVALASASGVGVLLFLAFVVLRPVAQIVGGSMLAFLAPVVAGVAVAALAWSYFSAHGRAADRSDDTDSASLD